MTETNPWTRDDDVFLNRLAEQVKSAPALLSKDEVFAGEETMRKDAWRRVALLTLTKPRGELCRKIADDRELAEVFAELYAELPAIGRRYQSLVKLLRAAQLRIMVALAGREDMSEVIEAGRDSLRQ